MTNFEKYHEEMIEKKYRAVKNGKPISCKSVGCSECELYDEGSTCTYSLLKWLAKEYKEPNPKLTEKEMYLCTAFEKGYLVRDNNVGVIFSEEKPFKTGAVWKNENPYSLFFKLPKTLQDEFKFISCKDKEPHSIEEMLTWEVE